MLLDSLLESGPGGSPHRCLATVLSFSLQAIALTALLSASLMYTGVLPPVKVVEPPPVFPRVDWSAVRVTEIAPSAPASGNAQAIHYEEPGKARLVRASGATMSNAAADENGPGEAPSLGVPGSTGASENSASWADLLRVQPPAPPTIHLEKPSKRPDMSQIMETMLIHRVEPEYPVLALRARVQGEVLLHAVISTEGTVEELRAISGNPLLVPAALNAVREWRYRPCMLNGRPIEVEAQIVVHFELEQ